MWNAECVLRLLRLPTSADRFVPRDDKSSYVHSLYLVLLSFCLFLRQEKQQVLLDCPRMKSVMQVCQYLRPVIGGMVEQMQQNFSNRTVGLQFAVWQRPMERAGQIVFAQST